jgi:hypothetical protein
VIRNRTLATEKQIAANRANAKHSTGPRTAAGKVKSSRNAFRHGLSSPMPLDLPSAAEVNFIARELAGEYATEDRLISAAHFASAQMELLRIREIRTNQFAKVDLSDGSNLREIERLAALDRYERYALTKRRRASKELKFKG